MASTSTNTNEDTPERPFVPFFKEQVDFEITQQRVKGLVDTGMTRIPDMFRHPPNEVTNGAEPTVEDDNGDIIPIIDLAGPEKPTLRQIYDASREVGFGELF